MRLRGASGGFLSGRDIDSLRVQGIDDTPDRAAALDVNGWQHVTCSLAPYAGQTIALQFRSWNDPLTFGADETKPAGFWVDNITVGSQVFDGSSMAGWQSRRSSTRPRWRTSSSRS